MKISLAIIKIGAKIQTGDLPATTEVKRKLKSAMHIGLVPVNVTCFKKALPVYSVIHPGTNERKPCPVNGIETNVFIAFITIISKRYLRLKGIQYVLADNRNGIIRVADRRNDTVKIE